LSEAFLSFLGPKYFIISKNLINVSAFLRVSVGSIIF